MRSRFVAPDDPAWMQFLARAEHDVYHLPGYVAVEAKRLRGEPGAILVEDGDRALLIPLIVRPLPNGVEGSDAASPYGYPGPLLTEAGMADPAFVTASGKAAFDLLAEMGCCSAFIRSHPLLPQAADLFAGNGAYHDVGPTVWIDLEEPACDRWSNLDPKIRGTIRRTYRDNFQVRVDEGWDSLATFSEIYASTMDRVHATESYYFDYDYFKELHDALGDKVHLFVVSQFGAVVGAGLFTEVGGTVQYHLSGTHKIKGRSPSAVLLDHASDWAAERGNRVLHLGGGLGGADDNLLRFKAGFSKQRGRYSVWHLVIDEKVFDLACQQAPAQPQDGSGKPGGFFPPYRTS